MVKVLKNSVILALGGNVHGESDGRTSESPPGNTSG